MRPFFRASFAAIPGVVVFSLGGLGLSVPMALAQQPATQQAPNQPPAGVEMRVGLPPLGGSGLESARACPAADGPASDRTYPIRRLAFEAIDEKRPAVARHLMRCALEKDPGDKIALRQEVYLDIDAGAASDAIGDIEALRGAGAVDPQLDAQEGYLYAGQKRYDLAKAAFRRAFETGDEGLRLQALEAIRNLRGMELNTLDLDVDSEYLNRFGDAVVDGVVRVVHRFGERSPFRLFAGVHVLRDTASKNGALPQIFSDNAFLSGMGVSFEPGEGHFASHFAMSVEANLAYVLFAANRRDAVLIPDYRAIGGYYNVFRARPNGRISNRLSLQANGSVGFYSRYRDDAIAYLQPQENCELLRGARVTVAPFVQESVALDSNRLFYNNTFELIPGVWLADKHLHGLSFRAEYVRGIYLPAASRGSPNPYGSAYGDFRFGLTFQRSIPLEKAGDLR